MRTTPSGRSQPRRTALRLDANDAFVAVMVVAMEANGTVSSAEAARAHDIIWATRRFRHRSGESVGRRIERMRRLLGDVGASGLARAAARSLPASIRQAAFTIATDIVLADGRLDRRERQFLAVLARDLRVPASAAQRIRDVIRIKNSA